MWSWGRSSAAAQAQKEIEAADEKLRFLAFQLDNQAAKLVRNIRKEHAQLRIMIRNGLEGEEQAKKIERMELEHSLIIRTKADVDLIKTRGARMATQLQLQEATVAQHNAALQAEKAFPIAKYLEARGRITNLIENYNGLERYSSESIRSVYGVVEEEAEEEVEQEEAAAAEQEKEKGAAGPEEPQSNAKNAPEAKPAPSPAPAPVPAPAPAAAPAPAPKPAPKPARKLTRAKQILQHAMDDVAIAQAHSAPAPVSNPSKVKTTEDEGFYNDMSRRLTLLTTGGKPVEEAEKA